MPSLLFRNIKGLLQVEQQPNTQLRKGAAMANLPSIEGAWLLVEEGRIADFGEMATCPERADEIVEANDQFVLPTWCDSHTHLVFAKSREGEFVDRIRGLSYAEIAERGGGILNSARKLRAMEEAELLEQAEQRLQEVVRMGTGAIEIKSGYGLSVEGELKMLRVIRALKERSEVPIKATFLGAHALPLEFKGRKADYITLLIKEVLPQIVAEGLADYIDIFCEKGFFSVEDTHRILEAGAQHGLKAKIHTNQFTSLGGIEAAIAHDALSVDHLEVLTEAEINALLPSNTIPTLLPSAPFFLNDPYPPARQMIDAGLGLALASDYNPGSSPSGNLPFVLSLACVKLRLLPEEALNALTINAACAMECADQLGSIAKGKWANLILSQTAPNYAYFPYAFGSNWIDNVYIKGKRQD